jgi:hypothetical protein
MKRLLPGLSTLIFSWPAIDIIAYSTQIFRLDKPNILLFRDVLADQLVDLLNPSALVGLVRPAKPDIGLQIGGRGRVSRKLDAIIVGERLHAIPHGFK